MAKYAYTHNMNPETSPSPIQLSASDKLRSSNQDHSSNMHNCREYFILTSVISANRKSMYVSFLTFEYAPWKLHKTWCRYNFKPICRSFQLTLQKSSVSISQNAAGSQNHQLNTQTQACASSLVHKVKFSEESKLKFQQIFNKNRHQTKAEEKFCKQNIVEMLKQVNKTNIILMTSKGTCWNKGLTRTCIQAGDGPYHKQTYSNFQTFNKSTFKHKNIEYLCTHLINNIPGSSTPFSRAMNFMLMDWLSKLEPPDQNKGHTWWQHTQKIILEV